MDTLCEENLIKLMSAAGCRAVYLGVESGSQRVLDMTNKNSTVEQIEQAINLCKNIVSEPIVGLLLVYQERRMMIIYLQKD